VDGVEGRRHQGRKREWSAVRNRVQEEGEERKAIGMRWDGERGVGG